MSKKYYLAGPMSGIPRSISRRSMPRASVFAPPASKSSVPTSTTRPRRRNAARASVDGAHMPKESGAESWAECLARDVVLSRRRLRRNHFPARLAALTRREAGGVHGSVDRERVRRVRRPRGRRARRIRDGRGRAQRAAVEPAMSTRHQTRQPERRHRGFETTSSGSCPTRAHWRSRSRFWKAPRSTAGLTGASRACPPASIATRWSAT
jgi:hypothetical protein